MLRQFYGVFAFSAAQFEHYRVIVPEKFAAPFPRQLKFFGL
jgi:hypothetical protein